MKTWLILLIAGASLAGCTTTPSSDPWAEIQVEESRAQRALDCGSFPLPDVVDHDRIEYTEDGTRQLEAYRICSEGNQGIADAHADQIDAQRRATAALVDAGKHQRAIAEMRREMLEEERRHALWERLQYWVVILAMAAAL